MQPHLVASRECIKAPLPPRSFATRALMIVWPAFVMAGVLEMLVFAVVDPDSLHWFGVEPLHWTRSAVYSVTFLIFWLVVSTSAAITHLLEEPGHS
jgi:hypothetical protein